MTNNAPAGWYTDPDDATSLRWWDGTAWSDQRAPAPVSPATVAASPRARLSSATWLWIAIAFVVLVVLAITAGPGAIVLVALAAIVLSIIALMGRRIPGLRTTTWKLGALGAGIVLLIGGTAAAAATSPREPTSLADLSDVAPSPRDTPTPTPTPEVTTNEIVVTEVVEFERTTQDDPGRDVGSSAVVQAGVNGTRTITYLVTYIDGVETERVVTSDEVTVTAVPEITAVGTRQPPPAPVAGGGSGCDPNYTGCVPIASDVDCAGGGGNGPEYVSGTVQVIGSDIYDLDRDGNGWGCD